MNNFDILAPIFQKAIEEVLRNAKNGKIPLDELKNGIKNHFSNSVGMIIYAILKNGNVKIKTKAIGIEELNENLYDESLEEIQNSEDFYCWMIPNLTVFEQR